ncbi:SWIM zinc finger family protein, partial [Oscillatoriales cyanobacterium LEGE 11467]
GIVTAQVRGSVNPYFGVYKEPTYITEVELEPISTKVWSKAIARLGQKASWVSKLLINEIPDNIDTAFSGLEYSLLPRSLNDLHTHCSCPDWSNPCKHVAGVCYLLAAELDADPFLLFELRGLSRDKLKRELAKSPLGKVLSGAIETEDLPLVSATSYYTTPETVDVPKIDSLRDFWLGEKQLPTSIEMAAPAIVPAIPIKKAGDFPAFWRKDSSFIDIMEEFYQRVRTKNKNWL